MNSEGKIIALSTEFSKVINKWLGKRKIKEINKLNATDNYKKDNLCATYDYCDPNMAMFEAFQNIFSTDFDPRKIR